MFISSGFFFQLYVIIEHSLVVFVDLFLMCLWWSRLEFLIKCSYFGPTLVARCSYNIVLMKKKRVPTNTYTIGMSIANKDIQHWICNSYFEGDFLGQQSLLNLTNIDR